MSSASEWATANKMKTGLGLIAALAAVIVIPIQVVAWAEDLTADKIYEAELIAQGRRQAIHSAQAQAAAKLSAKHDYDFYEIRAVQAEEQLLQLEEDADAGVQLTASQQRKMRRLEDQVETFQIKQDAALEKLAAAEETENET